MIGVDPHDVESVQQQYPVNAPMLVCGELKLPRLLGSKLLVEGVESLWFRGLAEIDGMGTKSARSARPKLFYGQARQVPETLQKGFQVPIPATSKTELRVPRQIQVLEGKPERVRIRQRLNRWDCFG